MKGGFFFVACSGLFCIFVLIPEEHKSPVCLGDFMPCPLWHPSSSSCQRAPELLPEAPKDA